MFEDPALAATTGRSSSFQRHLEQAMNGLRNALAALLDSVEADPSVPRRLARQLGVNKNLAWKAAKIVSTADAAEAVPHVPGRAGMKIFLEAMERAGASDAALSSAREACDAFDRMVELHAGDRGTLELMVGSSFASDAIAPLQEANRKLAFQGNSATWGVQARVRFGAQFIAPSSEDPEQLDYASIGGLSDFRRLRGDAKWPLSFNVRYNIDGTRCDSVATPIERSLESVDGPAFLLDHCSDPLPAIRAKEVPLGTVYELCEGEVGNTAAFSCAFGWFVRKLESVWGEPGCTETCFEIPLNTPVELATMDVLVHRDIKWQLPPKLVVRSRMEIGVGSHDATDSTYTLPSPSSLEELPDRSAIANSEVPRWGEMLGQVCERLDWNLDDFRVFRLALRYPPIPTEPSVVIEKRLRP